MEKMFSLCCKITDICAQYFGMSYGEFNVWVFLHIQPITYIIGFLCSFIICKNKYIRIYFIIGLLLSFIYYDYLIDMFPISNDAFNLSVQKLEYYSKYFFNSYILCNYFIFIFVFLFIHITNIILLRIK